MCACPDLGSNAELVFMRPWDMAFVAFNPLITLWPPFTPPRFGSVILFPPSFLSAPLLTSCSSCIFILLHCPCFLVKSPSVTDFSPLTWQVNSHGPGVCVCVCVCVCVGGNQTDTECTPSSHTLGSLWEVRKILTRSVSFVAHNYPSWVYSRYVKAAGPRRVHTI